MTTEAVAALGTLLNIGDGGSPEDFAPIAEVQDIGTLEEFLDFIEVTHHESVGREFIAGLPGMSDLTFNFNFIPAETTQGYETSGLRKDLRDKKLRNFVIEFTNGDSASFSAYVARFGAGAPVEGKLGGNATLKISGLVEWSETV